jgi:hypothetical protein
MEENNINLLVENRIPGSNIRLTTPKPLMGFELQLKE